MRMNCAHAVDVGRMRVWLCRCMRRWVLMVLLSSANAGRAAVSGGVRGHVRRSKLNRPLCPSAAPITADCPSSPPKTPPMRLCAALHTSKERYTRLGNSDCLPCSSATAATLATSQSPEQHCRAPPRACGLQVCGGFSARSIPARRVLRGYGKAGDGRPW